MLKGTPCGGHFCSLFQKLLTESHTLSCDGSQIGESKISSDPVGAILLRLCAKWQTY